MPPSRIASILAHKADLVSDAGRRVEIARIRERNVSEQFEIDLPELPEEGAQRNAVLEADGVLRDVHSRYLLCVASVKDALTQAQRIDAMTSDAIVRMDSRANLMELREKQLELHHDRLRAERDLRALPGFQDSSSVLAKLLDARRELEKLKEEYHELQADRRMAADTLRNYGEHTQLSLSKRIHLPRIPLPDDGRRCEMCNTGFPAGEVEISPCGHFYHIFCLAIRVAMYPECCGRGCTVPFPPCWLQNYGFPSQTVVESDRGSSSTDNDSINGVVAPSTSSSF